MVEKSFRRLYSTIYSIQNILCCGEGHGKDITMEKLILFALILVLCLSGCAILMKNPENTTGDPEDSFVVEQMDVKKGDMKIFGNLYIPKDAQGKLPAVILSHSSDMTSDSMKSYCQRMARMGYVAYAFDFCGGSSKSRSDGKRGDMTVFTEVDDLNAVLDTVRELEMVDGDQVFLFGTSQGGLVSALVAEERPADVRGLMLLYPGFNIAEMVQGFYHGFLKIPSNPFADALKGYDVYEHIGAYPGDVLILHGSKDFIVPPSASKKAAELYESCEFHLIEGANHGFNKENYAVGDFDAESWGYVEEYLTAHKPEPAE